MMELTTTDVAESLNNENTLNVIVTDGNAQDALSKIAEEYSEHDDTTVLRIDGLQDGFAIREVEVPDEDELYINGAFRNTFSYEDDDETVVIQDQRMLVESPYQAKSLMNDAWEVAHPKWNGASWHIDANEGAKFIQFATNRKWTVFSHPAFLIKMGRHHCPCASCEFSADTASELAGHIGGKATAGDEAHIQAQKSAESRGDH